MEQRPEPYIKRLLEKYFKNIGAVTLGAAVLFLMYIETTKGKKHE